jgi:hypothetical protein
MNGMTAFFVKVGYASVTGFAKSDQGLAVKAPASEYRSRLPAYEIFSVGYSSHFTPFV